MAAGASADDGPGGDGLPFEWVRALAAAAHGEPGASPFVAAVPRWLERVEKTPQGLARWKSSLAALFLDVDACSGALKSCPKLKELLQGVRQGREVLVRSRGRCLERQGGASLAPELVAFARKNLPSFVPDPSSMHGSNYRECAEWMAAVHELVPEECRKLLRRWKEAHPRRRNLWQALSAQGLPG
jgi:hypothetical protein